MTKKELEKQHQAQLVYMCEGKGLLHTGDKDALIAKLVDWEKSQKPEPEPEAPAPEPVELTEPEPPPPEE